MKISDLCEYICRPGYLPSANLILLLMLQLLKGMIDALDGLPS